MLTKIAARRLLRSLCVLPIFTALVATPATAEADQVLCGPVSFQVPIVENGPKDHTVAGTYCRVQATRPPRVVQLLVHGGTYTRTLWDWPQQPDVYSFARDAVSEDRGTLSIDRIGHGESSKPPSADVTIPNGNVALNEVVQQVRDGSLTIDPVDSVVWIGHSLGAVAAYDYGARYNDVDAFVFTGSVHFMKPSFLGLMTNNLEPAGPDAGYLTTKPGTRDDLFYRPASADPAVIAQDEALKDTITNGEIVSGLALLNVAPAQSPTQAIRKPVAVVMGEFDNLVCGGTDGLTCTPTALRTMEAPYFTNATRLDVMVVPGVGHSHLHLNAPALYTAITDWVSLAVPLAP
jgi:pimeloyl-ACP methyl ester carboxylesterase